MITSTRTWVLLVLLLALSIETKKISQEIPQAKLITNLK